MLVLDRQKYRLASPRLAAFAGTEQVQALLVTSRTAAAPLAADQARQSCICCCLAAHAEAAAPRRRARLRDGTEITLAAARAATPAAGAADLHAGR